MSTAGRQLLSSLVYSGDIGEYVKLSLEPYLFKETEVGLYEFMHEHISKHGKIPAQKTIEEKLGTDVLVEASEPPSYYSEEVEKRYLHNSLKASVQEASALLQGKQAEMALDKIMFMVGELYVKRKRKQIVNFTKDAANVVHKAYLQQKTMSNAVALPFGWPTLDEMSGGLRAGDFVSIVGRPMAGKTFMGLYTAMHAWKTGRVPIFFSMEMNTELIIQRLAAIYSKKKLTDLMKAELSSKAFVAMMQDLTDIQGNDTDFIVVDGNLTSTPEDMVMLARQFKPGAAWVDAAYLAQSTNLKIGKWEKQADNAQKLKQRMAQDLGIPVTASYQFSKGSEKEKKKNKDAKPSGADVYGSDEIFQLSSLMLGLFDDEDNIESKKTRSVEILKGRSGETGSFKINWDFSNKMDFSEYKKEDPADLQMSHLG